MNRRIFLKGVGSSAVVLLSMRSLTACEQLIIEPKIEGSETAFLTDARDGSWYLQMGSGIAKEDAPELSRESWSLELAIDGEVVSTVSFDQLEALAAKKLSTWKTMRCVFGKQVGTLSTAFTANGIFTGVALTDLLDALPDVSLPANIVKMRTFGADGFEGSIPIERVLSPGVQIPVLLAHDLNGAPLTKLRGAPVRLILQEKFGYKNVKWLERLDFSSDAAKFGKYEDELFGSSAIAEEIDLGGENSLMNIVTKPASGQGAEIQGPDAVLSGIVLTGHGTITGLEVSVDAQEFVPVTLATQEEALATLTPALRDLANQTEQARNAMTFPYPNVWVPWSHTITDLSPGTHTIVLRATDSRGVTQETTTRIPIETNPTRLSFTIV